jgi:energy-coupling factor transport system substrate-specific component
VVSPTSSPVSRRSGSTTLRVLIAIVGFAVASTIGVVAFGTFNVPPDKTLGYSIPGANSFALVLAIGLIVGFIAYGVTEYLQTGSVETITRQFDTRTIVLMPIAIAFNIILGQAVGSALKIPIYLDSIGTILVGALAGPIPGALTGFLSNILWTYVVPPPFHSDISGAFAIVAAVIGLLAGLFGRLGWLRPRTDRSISQLAVGGAVAVALIVMLAYLAFLGYTAILGSPALAPASDNGLFVILGWLAILLVAGTVIGLLALLFVRRDLTAAYVVVAGVITGIVAAAISAPISANVFGGVTGAGTDFLVAAFRQAGADIQAATLGQGLISDPIDKVTTFFVVYIILSAMAVRSKARFPQGERLIQQETLGEAPA